MTLKGESVDGNNPPEADPDPPVNRWVTLGVSTTLGAAVGLLTDWSTGVTVFVVCVEFLGNSRRDK